MGNMGYCRFQNTVKDLQDCLDNIDDELSSDDEISSRTQLIKICQEIAEIYEDGDTKQKIRKLKQDNADLRRHYCAVTGEVFKSAV
ncbi:MAG: hypothetical protein Q7J12_00135 [Syntrophales bacterium]|uniref:hypothetical protein n=1 Tax=Candidatus Wunengus sp. YC61 TaxID=3367698 RepID=UPI002728D51C|nr:hypothetical protein [Syntrophales bacterium]